MMELVSKSCWNVTLDEKNCQYLSTICTKAYPSQKERLLKI